MKLNKKCIYDILSDIKINYKGQSSPYKDIISNSTFNRYNDETINYSLKYIKDDDLASVSFVKGNNIIKPYHIADISPKGREYLKQRTLWYKIKTPVIFCSGVITQIILENIINRLFY